MDHDHHHHPHHPIGIRKTDWELQDTQSRGVYHELLLVNHTGVDMEVFQLSATHKDQGVVVISPQKSCGFAVDFQQTGSAAILQFEFMVKLVGVEIHLPRVNFSSSCSFPFISPNPRPPLVWLFSRLMYSCILQLDVESGGVQCFPLPGYSVPLIVEVSEPVFIILFVLPTHNTGRRTLHTYNPPHTFSFTKFFMLFLVHSCLFLFVLWTSGFFAAPSL